MKITSPHHLLILLLTFFFASIVRSHDLRPDEVQALKDIANTLGKKDWRNGDFPEDPCSAAVKCDCAVANDGKCHVVSMYDSFPACFEQSMTSFGIMDDQDLGGELPPELVRFPYLQEIDLSRNYLSGTIPPQWGSMMNLVNISLPGNRLTGPIPEELGNISTLKSLVLEFNQFSGKLPSALGNLSNIERLHLTSNNFTGELPLTFARLTALKEVLLGDNQFSGKIPDFIGSWTSLEILIIQGSGLSGPIPSDIFFLGNLSELRISDLNGFDSTFPQLSGRTKLKTLILKSCNINGTLPENLGKMSTLKTLDLSFNKLRGQIPSTFNGLSTLKYIYLTGNFLTGPVPAWSENVSDNGKYRDLSYNNFTDKNPGQQDCQQGKVNLFASSLMGNNAGPITCVGSTVCPKTFYSLHINCGGKKKPIGDTTYEDDSDPAGPATYKKWGTNWAFSSTGHFLDNESTVYIAHNISRLSMPNVELYTDARLSPSSLTYYGFCLGNGQYTVNLHFAEIMFTNDNTYSSLGRRVFDVYIQGKRMLKDFNIANEAGGVGKEVIKKFSVRVTRKTLEIRFYWAGKGTTDIPYKTVYGPLISAISVNHENGSISAGAIVAIVAAGVIIVILLSGILWWSGCLENKSLVARELKDLDLQTGLFTLKQIKAATNNFNISNKIGEGGFGPVYKGFLSDGSVIAVKQLSTKSKQGNREFINEIGIISALRHPCLVKLYGCCVEGDELLLVYEYMENNSLARALFGPEQCHLNLDWSTRHKICVGIARGLAFLHEESRLRIVHRDIKATNVLLDKDLNAKISDFGLAKLHEEDNTHISTRIAGTYGYMAPEYAMHGYLTDKADVYSFGIVALEIVSGRSNTIRQQKEDYFHLLDWAHFLKENGDLMELVDRRLGSDFNKEQVTVMINVALLCTNASSSLRPSMSLVLSMLEGRTVVPDLISDQNAVADKMKLEAMRQFYQEIEENKISEADTQTKSLIGPSTGSSISAADLYPVHLDSSYLEKRN